VPFANLLASADVKKGEISAKKCCLPYVSEGGSLVGPNLGVS
jgi:hypothetical protein